MTATRRRVVVTGAASGIGRATALMFANADYDVAVCDVNDVQLASVAKEIRAAGVLAWSATVDVADRDAMRDWAGELHAEGGAFDVVVNNAGVALSGAFLELPLDDWEWLLDINLRGVVYGCHFFIPPMVERGQGGHVVNISSVAGLVPVRDLSAYNAAKFGVVGLSESLRWELAEHNIGVTTICPGAVNTNIVRHGRMRGFEAEESVSIRDEVQKQFVQKGAAPERVAKKIFQSVGTRGGVRIVGLDGKIIHWLNRWAPAVTRWFADWQRQAALDRAADAGPSTKADE